MRFHVDKERWKKSEVASERSRDDGCGGGGTSIPPVKFLKSLAPCRRYISKVGGGGILEGESPLHPKTVVFVDGVRFLDFVENQPIEPPTGSFYVVVGKEGGGLLGTRCVTSSRKERERTPTVLSLSPESVENIRYADWKTEKGG